MSIADKIAKRTFPTLEVPICLDAALSAEYDSAVASVDRLSKAQRLAAEAGSSRARNPELASARKTADEVKARMRESTLVVRVVGVPFAEYNKIQRAHPGRKGHAEAFNPYTFFGDFLYKTATWREPDGEWEPISATAREQWDKLVDNLTDGEYEQLANAVHALNKRPQTAAFLVDSASTRTSDETSESPETSE